MSLIFSKGSFILVFEFIRTLSAFHLTGTEDSLNEDIDCSI